MAALIAGLEEDSMQGTPLGQDSFKIRIAIASKGKGKSGGARVITHVRVVAGRVYLLTIFDKSEQDALSDKELKVLVEQIPE
ncbi:MAG: type II toxin-antitoxin system RelE/ParE family toxin [Flavobacteriales bacterium]|nr:type II toxin-antitoxin system RelE/ParE family toxin [Flavobacteriales bacterium]